MKTKIFDVWISRKILSGSEEIYNTLLTGKDDKIVNKTLFIKATLTIELPEMLIEITETHFEDAYKKAIDQGYTTPSQLKDFMYSELFDSQFSKAKV